MNYREKIRKAIECPQLNNTRYGEWGALTLEQRKYIKRLLDELDSADNYVKKLYLENQKQKEVIDKAIEYIEKHIKYECDDAYNGMQFYSYHLYDFNKQDLLDILKEVLE